MSLSTEPKEDLELTLIGGAFDVRPTARELEVLVFINNREIGMWQVDNNYGAATFTIPKALLEEALKDETRLVTLMLRLRGVPSLNGNYGQPSTYGLHLEGLQFRPRAESRPK